MGTTIFEFPGNLIQNTVLFTFAGAALIQLAYYWLVFSRFAFYRHKPSPPAVDQPVSVVICARNEYLNLKKNLPVILQQDYPDYEVVVVNDSSDDDTWELLEDMAKIYPRLKPVNISQNLNFFTGKKFPLAIGIKSASYEILLLTDADCMPSGNTWIRNMAGRFIGKTDIVLGYSGYTPAKGLLNKVIRYETLWTAIQYLSLALLKIPYMGVGRNLAYKKSLFFSYKGFITHYNIPSGDDDLFINKAANSVNTTIETGPESLTHSTAKKRFSDWWLQKKRHLSTGKYYRFRHKFILGTFTVSQFVFFAAMITLIALNFNIYAALALYILRLASLLVVIKKSMINLQERNFLLLSPFADFFLLIIYILLAISNLTGKKNRWK